MIKFFRSLRKDQLKQSRPFRYLLYAIGEIILVVIGILIALQINNWNEQRKENKDETTILKSLRDNLLLAQNQMQQFDYEKKLKQNIIQVLNSVSLNGEKKYTVVDSIFQTALWDLGSSPPILNTYTDLKNANKLEIIKNTELKKKFTSLELNLTKLNNVITDRVQVQQLRMDNIAVKDINFVTLIHRQFPELDISSDEGNDYSEIMTDQRIRNLFAIKLSLTQIILNRAELAENEINELIATIEKELNESNK